VFENYVHTKEDLEAIEEALEYLERPELDFIFKDRNLIKNTLVISFDSKELFIWTKLETSKLEKISCRVKGWNAYKIGHELEIKDDDQRGWQSSVRPKKFLDYLPAEFNLDWYSLPKISGSLLTPFTEIHKKRREDQNSLDPYYSKESYLATIVHEFGHVYYDMRNPRFYSDSKETSIYMKLASKLYEENESDAIKNIPLRLLVTNKSLSETFAFCTDYYAASVFWISYKKDVDEQNRSRISSAIEEEKSLRLDTTDTLLSDAHLFAAVIGKVIVTRYPNDWPERLINFGEVKTL